MVRKDVMLLSVFPMSEERDKDGEPTGTTCPSSLGLDRGEYVKIYPNVLKLEKI